MFTTYSLPHVFQVKALGCDGSTSLVSWLDGLGLHEYLPNFLSSGYRTLECVKNLWELEIVNVRRPSLTIRPVRAKHVLYEREILRCLFPRSRRKLERRWTRVFRTWTRRHRVALNHRTTSIYGEWLTTTCWSDKALDDWSVRIKLERKHFQYDGVIRS